MNSLRELWVDKPFSASSDFNQIMGRNRFLKIRSHLTFCMSDEGNDSRNEFSSKILDDRLYSARSIMEQFWETSSKIAVPTGAMALDEADRGTKARYAAVTFNKSKPYKYVLRFYVVVGYMYQYCPSLWDYGRANKTGQSKATRYCSTHREMRRDMYSLDASDPSFKCSNPSSLWVVQVCHPTKIKPLKDIPGVGKIRYLFL